MWHVSGMAGEDNGGSHLDANGHQLGDGRGWSKASTCLVGKPPEPARQPTYCSLSPSTFGKVEANDRADDACQGRDRGGGDRFYVLHRDPGVVGKYQEDHDAY
jgi:hypothetical protein